MVLPTVGTGHHDPLRPLGLERGPHGVEVLQVGLDVLPLLPLERPDLAFFVPHQSMTSSSNVRKVSPYSKSWSLAA
jgi:hypothetical protein